MTLERCEVCDNSLHPHGACQHLPAAANAVLGHQAQGQVGSALGTVLPSALFPSHRARALTCLSSTPSLPWAERARPSPRDPGSVCLQAPETPDIGTCYTDRGLGPWQATQPRRPDDADRLKYPSTSFLSFVATHFVSF